MNDGGPAYPAHDYIVGDLAKDGFAKLGATRGMSLRDYFAAKAMQAMLCNPEYIAGGVKENGLAPILGSDTTVIDWEACCWRPPVREGVQEVV